MSPAAARVVRRYLMVFRPMGAFVTRQLLKAIARSQNEITETEPAYPAPSPAPEDRSRNPAGTSPPTVPNR